MTNTNQETTEMKTYQITSSAGVDMGTYDGETAADALDAMARDAGYESQADAAATVGAFEGTVGEVDGAIITALRRLHAETMSSWSGCVDTAGIADCGERHDAAREERAQDASDAADAHWDRAIEAVEADDLATARQEMEWARSLAAEWGDSSIETQAIGLISE